jgi:hypothetical protein
VKRSINQIRQLAKKLIEMHPPEHDHEELQGLVTRLTTEFYTHGHSIGRQEGRALGLPIADASDDLLDLMDRYYADLEVDLDLHSPWNPAKLLKAAQATHAGVPAQPPAPGPAMQLQGLPGVMPGPSTPAIQIVQAQPVPGPVVHVILERAYIETESTCDAFITDGSISQQVIPTPHGPQSAIAFEVSSEEWVRLA